MFNLYGTGKDVDRLIAKAKYPKAIRLLRRMLDENPSDAHLRKKLADVLTLSGDQRAATVILEDMVTELANDGFLTKAIAVVKKIQRIDPARGDLDGKLANLVQQRERLQAPLNSGSGAARAAKKPAPHVEAILSSPLFTDCSASGLAAFIQGLDLHTYQPGEIVISEGEAGSSLLVLAGGTVRVYVRNDQGSQAQLRMMQAGEFFGEISILTGQARTATVIAAEPCEILELGAITLQEIGKQYPRVSQVIREFCEKRASSPEELQARQDLELPL